MTENADVASKTLPEAEPTAATVARDELLYAIGREAAIVAKDQAGSASAALVELGRAYAVATGHKVSLRFVYTDQPVPDGFQPDTSVDLITFGESGKPFDSSMVGRAAEIDPPAATAARDSLLYSIANEAKHVSRDQAGTASAALVELARTYDLICPPFPSTSASGPRPNDVQNFPG